MDSRSVLGLEIVNMCVREGKGLAYLLNVLDRKTSVHCDNICSLCPRFVGLTLAPPATAHGNGSDAVAIFLPYWIWSECVQTNPAQGATATAHERESNAILRAVKEGRHGLLLDLLGSCVGLRAVGRVQGIMERGDTSPLAVMKALVRRAALLGHCLVVEELAAHLTEGERAAVLEGALRHACLGRAPAARRARTVRWIATACPSSARAAADSNGRTVVMEDAVLDGGLAPEALAAILRAGPDLTAREALPADVDGVEYAGRFGVRPPSPLPPLRHSALSRAVQGACLGLVRAGREGVTPPGMIAGSCDAAQAAAASERVVDALLRHMASHVPPTDAQPLRRDAARVVLFFALHMRAQLSLKAFDDEVGVGRSGSGDVPLPPREAGEPDTGRFAFGDRVRVVGLQKRQELNGQRGWVVCLAKEGRYSVRLAAGPTVSVKPENLARRRRRRGADAGGGSGDGGGAWTKKRRAEFCRLEWRLMNFGARVLGRVVWSLEGLAALCGVALLGRVPLPWHPQLSPYASAAPAPASPLDAGTPVVIGSFIWPELNGLSGRLVRVHERPYPRAEVRLESGRSVMLGLDSLVPSVSLDAPADHGKRASAGQGEGTLSPGRDSAGLLDADERAERKRLKRASMAEREADVSRREDGVSTAGSAR